MSVRLLALASLALLGGCLAGEPVNPNVAAPKLLVQPQPDGNVTLYVHGAFSERLYDWIAVRIDNGTETNVTRRFSLEQTVPATNFYAEVLAGVNDQQYETRVSVDVATEDERALVAFLDDKGRWSDARQYGLPFGTILERRDPS